MEEAKNIHNFLRFCYTLKKTKRTGWVKNGVELPESIADHLFGIALMALVIPVPQELDRTRCIKMALVHDLAECIVGDYTPGQVSDEQKFTEEENGMILLRDTLKLPIGDEILSLWREYEQGTTPESIFVKQLDKLEMLFQASEYEHSQNKNLQQFYDTTMEKFSTPQILNIVKEIEDYRQTNNNNSSESKEQI